MPSSRRTSRRPVTVRHGSIKGSGFSATEYKGTQPEFRGRISVERGSGFVEFPDADQLVRILREEGIDTSAATQAFGHMKRRTSKRRTSRPVRMNGPSKPTAKVTSVRNGVIRATALDPKTGEKADFEFVEYAGKDPRMKYVVFVHRVDRPSEPGVNVLPQSVEAVLVNEYGIPRKFVSQAFPGIMKAGVVTPITQQLKMYGDSKWLKMGYFVDGKPVAGRKPGILTVFHKKTGKILVTFEINPSKDRSKAGKPDKTNPIRWGQGWLGSPNPGGRAIGWDDAYRKAQEYGIPEGAFIRVFGHLIPRKKVAQIWAGIEAASIARRSSSLGGISLEPEEGFE